jgi:predicted phage-related endonuclease
MVGKVTDDCKASGSIIPAIMGHSPYRTPNETLKDVFDHLAGTANEWGGNEATAWGNTLEPILINEAARRLGVRDFNTEIDYALKHPTLPLEVSLDCEAVGKGQRVRTDPSAGIFCMGSDEVQLNGPGAIEAKVTSRKPEELPALGRGPLQLQAQMMCGGYAWGALAILYRGTTMRVFIFEPHPATVKAITDAVVDFDERLRSDPVRWYSVENSADACLVYNQPDEEEPKVLEPAFTDAAKEFLLLKETIKDGQDALSQIGTEIQKEMGNHTLAIAGQYEIRWPMRRSKATPEKIIPAKPATEKRQTTIAIKEIKK